VRLVVGAFLVCALTPAWAGGHLVSEHVTIHAPWSRSLPAVVPNGAAYFKAHNPGSKAVRIVGATSSIAKRVELHTHKMENGLAKMRKVEGGVVIPSQGSVEFVPGGLHVMLMGLNEPLVAGSSFALTLRFDDGGALVATVDVMSSEDAAKLTPKGHDGHGGHAMKSKGHDGHGGHDMKPKRHDGHGSHDMKTKAHHGHGSGG